MAVNVEANETAACKLISITQETTNEERKKFEKEMKIHARMKDEHVLKFLTAAVVELQHEKYYVPGFYIFLEYAAGGDLFDKIGGYAFHVCEV